MDLCILGFFMWSQTWSYSTVSISSFLPMPPATLTIRLEHLPLKPKAKIFQSLSLLHIRELPFPSGRTLWEPGRIAGLKHFGCVWGEGAGWTLPWWGDALLCTPHLYPISIPGTLEAILHTLSLSLSPAPEWPNDLGEGYQMGFHMIMESNLYTFSYHLRAKHEVTIYQRKHMW